MQIEAALCRAFKHPTVAQIHAEADALVGVQQTRDHGFGRNASYQIQFFIFVDVV